MSNKSLAFVHSCITVPPLGKLSSDPLAPCNVGLLQCIATAGRSRRSVSSRPQCTLVPPTTPSPLSDRACQLVGREGKTRQRVRFGLSEGVAIVTSAMLRT